MHFVNATEAVSVISTEKRAGTASPLQRFVSRYFYFCMSLVFAGLVVWGFSRTVNDNLFHAALPRPLLLWIHGGAFSIWVVFFIAQSTLVRTRNVSGIAPWAGLEPRSAQGWLCWASPSPSS